MDVSIIIVNYNVRHFLEGCLRSVKKAIENIKGEIIVVDNNSVDGSCAMVKKLFPDVKLIVNNTNCGYAAANNQALNIVRGKYVLLLNPDTVIPEDSIVSCLGFMEEHHDAGALGVRMIDGKGRFLPESKRGLPDPATAFFKITGLYRLFPRSSVINKYYLGHLPENMTLEVDVVTGAFMFLRMTALEKTGNLDEDYFMYGEDIDLCFRLKENGFSIYYLPEPSIIHFKGESTRRSGMNYTLNFYRSMLIFVRKHLRGKNNLSLIWIINLAIIFRAGISVISKIFNRIALPVVDMFIIYLVYIIIIPLWEKIRFGENYHYPDLFTHIIIPGYIIVWILSAVLLSGYRRPLKMANLIRGLTAGVVATFIIYALLPLDFRFSRALLLTGSASSLILIPITRYLYSLAGLLRLPGFGKGRKRVIIMGNIIEYENIVRILKESGMKYEILGRVDKPGNDNDLNLLGTTGQLDELFRINKPDIVIFSSDTLGASFIIDTMTNFSATNIDFKLAQSASDFVLGSRSRKNRGEIFSFSIKE